MRTREVCDTCPLKRARGEPRPPAVTADGYIVTTRSTRYGMEYALIHADEIAYVRSCMHETVVVLRANGRELFCTSSVVRLQARFARQLLMLHRGLAAHRDAIVALTHDRVSSRPQVLLHGCAKPLPVSRHRIAAVRALFRDFPGRRRYGPPAHTAAC